MATGADVGADTAGSTGTGVDADARIGVTAGVGSARVGSAGVGSDWEHETIPAASKTRVAMAR